VIGNDALIYLVLVVDPEGGGLVVGGGGN